MLSFLILIASLADTNPDVSGAVAVRLKSGQEVVGTIEAFDDARGITMRRFDNGGKVELLWQHITPEDVKQIREAHGFYEDDAQPIMVDAVRLVFAGDKEEIGLIVGQTATGVLLKQGGRQTEFPRNRVLRVEQPVKVDALRVYTSDELYQQKIAESPPSTAAEHYYTGVFCESIGRFDLALEHYKAASAADPGFKPKDVQQKMTICTYKIEKHEQTDRLDEIKQMLIKRNYPRAFELCKSFPTQFPNSPLRPEAEKLLTQGTEQQKKYLANKVGLDYLHGLDVEAGHYAANRDLDFKQAILAMRDQVANTVFEQVAKNYGVDPALLKSIFPNRNKGSNRTASYGGGTFILDEEALKGMDKKKDAQKDAKSAEAKKQEEQETLEQRIGKIIKEREKNDKDKKKARGGPKKGGIADVPPKRDEWWAAAPATERKSFLLAYFAEHAKDGLLELVDVFPRNCSTCSGLRYLDVIDRTNGEVQVACPRCKTLGVDRVVTYH
jgi:hypothetical protein